MTLNTDARVLAGLRVDAGSTPGHKVNAAIIRSPEPDNLQASGVLAVVAECRGGPGSDLVSRLLVETLVGRFHREHRAGRPWLVPAIDDACRAIRSVMSGRSCLSGLYPSCAALLLHGGVAHGAFIGAASLVLLRRAGSGDCDCYRLSGDGAAQPLAHATVAEWPRPVVVHAADRFLLHSEALPVLREAPDQPRADKSYPEEFKGVRYLGCIDQPQVVCDALIDGVMMIERMREVRTPLAAAMLAISESAGRPA